MTDRLTRIWLPAVGLMIAIAAFVSQAETMPDPIAVHFDFGGNTDGSLNPVVYFGVMVAVWVIVWLTLAQSVSVRSLRWYPIGSYTGFGVLSAAHLVIVLVNREANSWQTADPGAFFLFGSIAAGAVLGAVVGWSLRRAGAMPSVG